jgi:aspartate ammonia-lyase
LLIRGSVDQPAPTGKGLLEIIREKKVLSEEQIKELLDPAKLTNLDKSKYPQ